MRVRFPDKNSATTFKGRVHTMRFLDRKENCKIYSEADPMYGRSVYDPLMIKTEPPQELPGGKWEYPVSIIKLSEVHFETEELT